MLETFLLCGGTSISGLLPTSKAVIDEGVSGTSILRGSGTSISGRVTSKGGLSGRLHTEPCSRSILK